MRRQFGQRRTAVRPWTSRGCQHEWSDIERRLAAAAERLREADTARQALAVADRQLSTDTSR